MIGKYFSMIEIKARSEARSYKELLSDIDYTIVGDKRASSLSN